MPRSLYFLKHPLWWLKNENIKQTNNKCEYKFFTKINFGLKPNGYKKSFSAYTKYNYYYYYLYLVTQTDSTILLDFKNCIIVPNINLFKYWNTKDNKSKD